MNTQTPSPKAQADALIARGRALIEQGDLPTATDLLNQAVKLYWSIDDFYSAAAQTGNYGWILRRMGRPDLAKPYLEQAASIFSEMGLTDFAERHRFAAEDVASTIDPEFLRTLPPSVRSALERGDSAGLQFALDSLEGAEQQQIYNRLITAGIISAANTDEANEVIQQFEPLLNAIATVAKGDQSDRAEVETSLDDLERKGWRIRKAVHKIWKGERRVNPLTHGLDPADSALVKRILELI